MPEGPCDGFISLTAMGLRAASSTSCQRRPAAVGLSRCHLQSQVALDGSGPSMHQIQDDDANQCGVVNSG
jgi:hypothetical protein